MQQVSTPACLPVPAVPSKRGRPEEKVQPQRRRRLSGKQAGPSAEFAGGAPLPDVDQKVDCTSFEVRDPRLPFGLSDDEAPLIDEAPRVDEEETPTGDPLAVLQDAGQNPSAPVAAQGPGAVARALVGDASPQHGGKISSSVGRSTTMESSDASPQAGSEAGFSLDAELLAAQLVAAGISPRPHSVASGTPGHPAGNSTPLGGVATPGSQPAGSATPMGFAGTPSQGRQTVIQAKSVMLGQRSDGRLRSVPAEAEVNGNAGMMSLAEKKLHQIIKVEDSPRATNRGVKTERCGGAPEGTHDERDAEAMGIVKTLVWLDEMEASVLQLQKRREAVVDMLHVLASLHTLEA